MNEKKFQQKRRSFVIYGVHEPPHEKSSELREAVLEILNKIMEANVDTRLLLKIRRIGKYYAVRRPVLVECITEWLKTDIMHCDHKLRGTEYNILDNLTPEQVDRRKSKMYKMREFRAKGLHAVMQRDKLIVNGEEYKDSCEMSREDNLYDGKFELNPEKKKQLEVLWKKNNIILNGIDEAENETLKDVRETAVFIFNNMMQSDIGPYEIDSCWRLGKKQKKKRRPVLVKFVTDARKKEIMGKHKLLRGTDINVKPDRTRDEIQERYRKEKEIVDMRKNFTIWKAALDNYMRNRSQSYMPNTKYVRPNRSKKKTKYNRRNKTRTQTTTEDVWYF